MKVTVLGDATPCRLVNEYRSFKRTYCCCRYMPTTLNGARPKQSSLCNKQHKYKVPLHSTRCRGSRGIAPRILNVGTR